MKYEQSTFDKVDHGNKTFTPIVITDPTNNKIHVDFVDQATNQKIGNGYDIDVTRTGQDSYLSHLPQGYILNNPDGKYQITGGSLSGSTLKATIDLIPAKYQDFTQLTTGDTDVDNFLKQLGLFENGTLLSGGENDATDISGNPAGTRAISIWADGKSKVTWWNQPNSDDITSDNSFDSLTMDLNKFNWLYDECNKTVTSQTVHKLVQDAYNEQHLPIAFADSNNNIIGVVKTVSGKVGSNTNVNLTLPDGYQLVKGETLPKSVTFANDNKPVIIKVEQSGQLTKIHEDANYKVHVHFVDQMTGQAVGGDYDIDLSETNGSGFNTHYLKNDEPGPFKYSIPQGYTTSNDTYHLMFDGPLGVAGTDPNTPSNLSDYMSENDALKIQQLYRDVYFMKSNTPIGQADNVGAEVFLAPNQMNELMLKDEPSWVTEYSQWKDKYGFTPGLANEPQDDIVMRVKVTRGSSEAWFSLPIKNVSQDVLKNALQQHRDAYKKDPSGISPDAAECEGKYILLAYFIGETGITDTGNYVNGNTVTVPVHKSTAYSFIDNSNNIQSHNGSTINVSVLQPSNNQKLAIDFIDDDPSHIDTQNKAKYFQT